MGKSSKLDDCNCRYRLSLPLDRLVHDRGDVLAFVSVGRAHNHCVHALRRPLTIQMVEDYVLWPGQRGGGVNRRRHVQQGEMEVGGHCSCRDEYNFVSCPLWELQHIALPECTSLLVRNPWVPSPVKYKHLEAPPSQVVLTWSTLVAP